jgi:hypothetical protein
MYFADCVRWCLPFGWRAATLAAFTRTIGSPVPAWGVIDTSGLLDEVIVVAWWPVVVAECPVTSSATGAPEVLPMVNATARPAAAAGTAANGRRRLTGELATGELATGELTTGELAVVSVLTKGFLPAEAALTRKAVCTAHW